MATFRRRGDAWQAEIRRRGFYRSATFATKSEARAWAARIETDYLDGRRGKTAHRTLDDALARYAREVSPKRRGARWEAIRLTFWRREMSLRHLLLSELTPEEIGKWRDSRLKEVSAGTVLREFSLLSAILETARKEWKWLATNPLADVRKPPQPQPRKRLISDDEAAKVVAALNGRLSAQVGIMFRLSLETAMRAGEIHSLTWERINGRVALLPLTKNGEMREVPLSTAAMEIIHELPHREGPLFDVQPGTRDELFRRAREKARLSGFTFHDARATALTRLARRVDVLTLARIAGHRDIRTLMVYYRESASDIASRLD